MTTTVGFDPVQVMERLEQIENDLAVRQMDLEAAAREWFTAKREKEKQRALAFIEAQGTVAERNAIADAHTAYVGKNAEADWEALRAVVRTLETRASIGQSLLRSMGRGA